MKLLKLNEKNWIWRTKLTVYNFITWEIDLEAAMTLKSLPNQEFLNFTPSKNLNQLLMKQAIIWCFFHLYNAPRRDTVAQAIAPW